MNFTYSEENEAQVSYPEAPSSIFPIRIETSRLVFEAVPFSSLTLQELYDLHTSDSLSEVFDTIPMEEHSTPKETKEFIEKTKESFVAGERVSYIIYEKSEGSCSRDTAVGVTGGHIDWDLYEFSCYIWLLPKAQGNGYSKERGEAFLQLAFDELSLETVRVSVLPDNAPSKKAIEGYICENGGKKEGMKRNGVRFDSTLKDIINYSITKEEWRG